MRGKAVGFSLCPSPHHGCLFDDRGREHCSVTKGFCLELGQQLRDVIDRDPSLRPPPKGNKVLHNPFNL